MARDGSELDWQAFQYIAGELTTEEAARFESRLAIDQAAREAVAAAVALSEVAAVTECRPIELVTPLSVSHTHWAGTVGARRLAWLGWGAAACLFVVAFVQQLGWNPWLNKNPLNKSTVFNSSSGANGDSSTRSGDPAAFGAGGPRSQAAPDLALAWVHTRTSVPIADRLEEELNHEDQASVSEVFDADDRPQEEAAISAPSWMVIAVAGLTVDMSEVE